MAPALAGHRAVITGATRNIGLAIAHGFARDGADLVLAARSGPVLEEVAAELRSTYGTDVQALATDLRDPEDVAALVEVANADGGVDILVNNAYSSAAEKGTTDVLEVDEGTWQSALDLNLLAPIRLIRGLGPLMRQRGRGSVINMVTTSQPIPGFAVPGTAKGALWSLTRNLAVELAPEIRVNAICPGTITNPAEERSFDLTPLIAAVPLGRAGHPDEVVGAARFLASAASSYTTGAVIPVNGGRPW